MRQRKFRRLAPHLEKHLRHNGPCTSYDMAVALGVKPKTVSEAMNQMVKRGIARRSDLLAGVTTRTVWELAAMKGKGNRASLPVRRGWLAVGAWRLPEQIPRTSVFDTREFTEEA